MRRYMSSILVVILLLTAGQSVLAMARAHVPVTVTIPQMIILELDANELIFAETDFDYILGSASRIKTGIMATKIEAVTATVSGNVPYTLLISAPEEFLYGQRGGLVHISQLRWRHSPAYDGGVWEEITLERRPVQSGRAGVAEVAFDFRLTVFWENPAQIYAGAILLTVVADSL
ncbi:MAG TPA: hypothetical protein GX521_01090 [Firmicutes bacterium]|nr:hypothetical protein [Bacillota bacterium]